MSKSSKAPLCLLLDNFTILPPTQLDGATTEKLAQLFAQMAGQLKDGDVEFWLAESPLNRYKPEPPFGFTAYRSNKRRLFIHRTLTLAQVLADLDAFTRCGQAIISPL